MASVSKGVFQLAREHRSATSPVTEVFQSEHGLARSFQKGCEQDGDSSGANYWSWACAVLEDAISNVQGVLGGGASEVDPAMMEEELGRLEGDAGHEMQAMLAVICPGRPIAIHSSCLRRGGPAAYADN
jgi:hypothetical protein